MSRIPVGRTTRIWDHRKYFHEVSQLSRLNFGLSELENGVDIASPNARNARKTAPRLASRPEGTKRNQKVV